MLNSPLVGILRLVSNIYADPSALFDAARLHKLPAATAVFEVSEAVLREPRNEFHTSLSQRHTATETPLRRPYL